MTRSWKPVADVPVHGAVHAAANRDAAQDPRIVWPPELPATLEAAGVSDEQWGRWMDAIVTSHRHGNTFLHAPLLGLCYWCCPLLCLQPCICIACPTTWHMAIAQGRAHDECEDAIRREAPSGLHFKLTIWHHAMWESHTLHEIRLRRPGLIAQPLPADRAARRQV